MGLRYVVFRVKYAIESKLGLLTKKFPINPEPISTISLKQWRIDAPVFFFKDRETIKLPKQKHEELEQEFKNIQKGIFTFFGKSKFDLGKANDWITNPDSGYRYNKTKHFTKIQDISSEAGDIKYVWEKARFSYLYTIIRYDYHFNQDNSTLVFDEIEDFIVKNPINQGPNYICSQETSLRILNWTFALYFYKNSDELTEDRFDKIMNSIYWQVHHVYHNIQFSRIAVRNNHAITETLLLYLSGKLFPFFNNTNHWSRLGKKWFEKEIDYQIYDDGTYLQYSMNYHRVVVQLLTWGIRLSELHQDKFNKNVYEKAQKSLHFLDACLNENNGHLPNYGSNDGALFFKLTNDDYRDYRSQLDDLRAVLQNINAYKTLSYNWYGIHEVKAIKLNIQELCTYDIGGYYLINENNSKTFIKCGAYKDRPAQADNLHLDIWVGGQNYLWDTGSYKYNTTEEFSNYFKGTEGHNTVSISYKNQMLKGSRFIWYYWVKKAKTRLNKEGKTFVFKGEIEAFKELGNNISHERLIKKVEGELKWEITDVIKNKEKEEITQYWHVNPDVFDKVKIETSDNQGNKLVPNIEDKWYSGYYGMKTNSKRITYTTKLNSFHTTINIIEN